LLRPDGGAPKIAAFADDCYYQGGVYYDVEAELDDDQV
jgi:hypothetical protein